MRAATDEFWEEYCIEMMNAQSEEEIEMVKQEMISKLKEFEFNESAIQNFFAKSEEMVNNEILMETNTELGVTREQNNNINVAHGALIGGFGIGISAFIATLALKKKIFMKDNQKRR